MIQKLRDWFLRDLWREEPPPGRRGWPRLLGRTAVMVVEGCWNQELLVRSAALTFKVAFSIVPLLAVILALFKGFGGFKAYADEVRDFILKYLAAGVGSQVSDSLSQIIDRTNATAMGLVGFGILLYSAITLLSSIEAAFNVIWGVRRQRSILRQVTVYWTILTIGPIALAVTLGARTFITSHSVYTWASGRIPLANDLLVQVLPFAMIWAVFAMMYIIMPNTKVPPKAALIGALVSGTAWELLFRLYVSFNGFILDRYAIYGSLSVIPVFLMWIYVSWILVLFGAEVAFAAQHVRTYRREVGAVALSNAFKERLAVHLMIEVARDFLAGREAPGGEALAERMKVPVRACREVLHHLGAGKLVRELASGQNQTYLPAEDLERITVQRVLDAIRLHGDAPPFEARHERLEALLTGAERASADRLGQVSIRDLARGDNPVGDAPPAR